jgi:hypothetical protein
LLFLFVSPVYIIAWTNILPLFLAAWGKPRTMSTLWLLCFSGQSLRLQLLRPTRPTGRTTKSVGLQPQRQLVAFTAPQNTFATKTMFDQRIDCHTETMLQPSQAGQNTDVNEQLFNVNAKVGVAGGQCRAVRDYHNATRYRNYRNATHPIETRDYTTTSHIRRSCSIPYCRIARPPPARIFSLPSDR